MLALTLIGVGAAIFGGAVVYARASRSTVHPHVDRSEADVWAPPSDELERGRPRVWIGVVALVGLGITASGFAVRPSPRPARGTVATSATARPTLISVSVPTATPDPTPTPTPSPSPAPPVSPSNASSAEPAARPSSVETIAAPRKPGPEISSSARCTVGDLWVGYSVTARAGTTITAFRLTAAGIEHNPGARNSTGHSGSWQRSVPAGSHTVRLVATSSDGGTTDRHHHVTC